MERGLIQTNAGVIRDAGGSGVAPAEPRDPDRSVMGRAMNETRLAYWQRRFEELIEEARLEPLTDDARDTLIKHVKSEADLLAFGPPLEEPEPEQMERAVPWWDR